MSCIGTSCLGWTGSPVQRRWSGVGCLAGQEFELKDPLDRSRCAKAPPFYALVQHSATLDIIRREMHGGFACSASAMEHRAAECGACIERSAAALPLDSPHVNGAR
jgi:hypothetical protein